MSTPGPAAPPAPPSPSGSGTEPAWEALKNKGNAQYSRGNSREAIRFYSEALAAPGISAAGARVGRFALLPACRRARVIDLDWALVGVRLLCVRDCGGLTGTPSQRRRWCCATAHNAS
jgi:hypothetical protein